VFVRLPSGNSAFSCSKGSLTSQLTYAGSCSSMNLHMHPERVAPLHRAALFRQQRSSSTSLQHFHFITALSMTSRHAVRWRWVLHCRMYGPCRVYVSFTVSNITHSQTAVHTTPRACRTKTIALRCLHGSASDVAQGLPILWEVTGVLGTYRTVFVSECVKRFQQPIPGKPSELASPPESPPW
jgi:hypothetical protein